MHRYVVRRILEAAVTLFGTLVLLFVILRVIPGDPALMMLSEFATPEDLTRVRARMGLDEPILTQLWIFLQQIAAGDFGTSYRTQTPALELVWAYLPATLQLAGSALLLTILIAIPFGVLAALNKGSLGDYALTLTALLGQSIPVFWLGILLVLVFSVQLNWLPTSGHGGLLHLVLPTITLAFSQIALTARIMRSSALEALRQDYVRTARAMGHSETFVVVFHVMRNALAPVVTILGLQLGTLLGGAIVTETVFAWPGAGRLLVESIGAQDYPVVQVMVVLSAFVFVATMLLVDLLYVMLDPRVRLA